MDRLKNLVIVVDSFVLIFLLVFIARNSGKSTNPIPTKTANSRQTINDETEFPALHISADLFEPSDEGIGAGDYSVIPGKQAFQSYPSMTISMDKSLYSASISALPPVKSDGEIYAKDQVMDFMGDAKRESIRKFGDLARRYAGNPEEGWHLDSIREADVDSDGSKESILMLINMGANIIGQRNEIIKGDSVIFSTAGTTFSSVTPAKTGNGFFLQWDDNFKQRDGHVTTRFIFKNSQFIPVYEQKVRYIRLKSDN